MTTKTAQIAITQEESIERDFLRGLGILMTLIGIGVTAYLSYVKLADTSTVCVESETFDCSSVQNSVYSEIAGIPIALLGLGSYLAILGVLFLEDRIEFFADYGKTLLFSMTLFGFLYSGYLTYIEGFVLEKWCMWCMASAILMTGMFALSTTRMLRDFDDDEE